MEERASLHSVLHRGTLKRKSVVASGSSTLHVVRHGRKEDRGGSVGPQGSPLKMMMRLEGR